MTEKTANAKVEQLVYALYRVSRCHGCDRKLEKGEIVKLEQGLEEQRAFCSKCASLEGLEILPSGNAKVTRLVKKYSTRCYIVMRWSEVWKTYERQGLYVEPDAVAKARAEAAAEPKGAGASKTAKSSVKTVVKNSTKTAAKAANETDPPKP